MISGFFSDLFGVLYVPDNVMAVINAKRKRERKLPIHLGEICPAPDDVRPPVDDADALLEKELTTLNTYGASDREFASAQSSLGVFHCTFRLWPEQGGLLVCAAYATTHRRISRCPGVCLP